MCAVDSEPQNKGNSAFPPFSLCLVPFPEDKLNFIKKKKNDGWILEGNHKALKVSHKNKEHQ